MQCNATQLKYFQCEQLDKDQLPTAKEEKTIVYSTINSNIAVYLYMYNIKIVQTDKKQKCMLLGICFY